MATKKEERVKSILGREEGGKNKISEQILRSLLSCIF
jgi:hypothetical protein